MLTLATNNMHIDIHKINMGVLINEIPSHIKFYYKRSVLTKGKSLEIAISSFPMLSFMKMIILIISVIFIIILLLGRLLSYFARYRLSERVSDEDLKKKFNKMIIKTHEFSYLEHKNDFNNDVCVICLKEYETKSMLRTLLCTHTFHKECIDTWIKSQILGKPCCPICKDIL